MAPNAHSIARSSKAASSSKPSAMGRVSPPRPAATLTVVISKAAWGSGLRASSRSNLASSVLPDRISFSPSVARRRLPRRGWGASVRLRFLGGGRAYEPDLRSPFRNRSAKWTVAGVRSWPAGRLLTLQGSSIVVRLGGLGATAGHDIWRHAVELRTDAGGLEFAQLGRRGDRHDTLRQIGDGPRHRRRRHRPVRLFHEKPARTVHRHRGQAPHRSFCGRHRRPIALPRQNCRPWLQARSRDNHQDTKDTTTEAAR